MNYAASIGLSDKRISWDELKALRKSSEVYYVEAALVLSELGDTFEHRLRCAFSAWALMGFMQRWLSLTDRPIPEMLPYLSEFHAGVQADAMRYLTGGAGYSGSSNP